MIFCIHEIMNCVSHGRKDATVLTKLSMPLFIFVLIPIYILRCLRHLDSKTHRHFQSWGLHYLGVQLPCMVKWALLLPWLIQSLLGCRGCGDGLPLCCSSGTVLLPQTTWGNVCRRFFFSCHSWEESTVSIQADNCCVETHQPEEGRRDVETVWRLSLWFLVQCCHCCRSPWRHAQCILDR